MQEVMVVGRGEFDETDERSNSRLVHEVRVPYEGGAVGSVSIKVYRSTQTEDRGGLVLQITVDDEASSFLPFARSIQGGVELHMAGDIESKSLVHALRTALATVTPVV